MLHPIELTDEEIVVLARAVAVAEDLPVRPELERAYSAAKMRLRLTSEGVEERVADLVTRARGEAEAQGRLIFQHKHVRHCPVCREDWGYVKYKGGRNRGQPNYDKPIHHPGVELAKRFMVFRGHATLGCCWACWTEEVKPLLIRESVSWRAELPLEVTDRTPEWKWLELYKCRNCGHVCPSDEVGPMPCLMFGTYPGRCLQCGAQRQVFGIDGPSGMGESHWVLKPSPNPSIDTNNPVGSQRRPGKKATR